jgi:hypothetical protein
MKGVIMLKVLAILFGIVFVAIGVLGFLPQYAPAGKLFNLFSVNPAHNLIHLATGAIAILCGFSSTSAARFFFIIFGLVYAAVAGLGFYQGGDNLFGMIAINKADNWLHAGIAVISLYLGFFVNRR